MTLNLAPFQQMRRNKKKWTQAGTQVFVLLEAHPTEKVNSCVPTAQNSGLS